MTLHVSVKTPSLEARLPRALMLAAPVAAIGYPFLLKGFNAGITSDSHAYAALAAVTLSLAICMPLVGLSVALQLGRRCAPTATEVCAKWVALLSASSAPIYTALGVLLYMAGDPISDLAVWMAGWTVGLGLMARAAFATTNARPARGEPEPAVSPHLRVAHGISAMVLAVIFLGMHLINHLAGLWSEAAHRSLMELFRNVYRGRFIEPVVVTLCLFMVGSGLMMVSHYVRRSADVFRTLQLVSGVYLVFSAT